MAKTPHPTLPGRYLIQSPDETMTIEDRAFQMWAVHPSDLDGLGMSREEFYLAHLKAVHYDGVEQGWVAGCDR